MRLPTPGAPRHIRNRQPGTHIKIEPDANLANMINQDNYSFELTNVYVDGRDRTDVLDKYDPGPDHATTRNRA